METGIVTEENLQSILRQIGQKRRQGVLELVYGNRRSEVHFIQGKAVEAVCDGQSPAREVLAMFHQAGLVPHRFDWKDAQEESYRALLLGLAQCGIILDEDLFRRAIRQRVLDRIYALDLGAGAAFNFRAQMVEVDREFSPTISVGQLLLDIVALPHDRERFNKLFSASSWLTRTEVPEGVLTAEERVLYDCIGEELTCEQLEARAMLSHFHFMDGLLALHERGLIAIKEAPSLTIPGPSVKDMLHRTVVSTIEASSLVDAIGDTAPRAESKEGESAEADSKKASVDVPVGINEAPPQPEGQRERWSLRALESAAAVQLVAVIYLLIAFSVPWMQWVDTLSFFSK